jgi:hypothetical protein
MFFRNMIAKPIPFTLIAKHPTALPQHIQAVS